jgi:hypothetical protein
MTLNLKIEILKVFTFDLNFSSDNKKLKKEEENVKTSDPAPDATKSK